MMIEFLGLVLLFFGITVRVIGRKIRAVSNVPGWVGDSAHFGLGMLASGFDPVHAYVTTFVYVAYQIVDYLLHRDRVELAVYLSGYVSGVLGRTFVI